MNTLLDITNTHSERTEKYDKFRPKFIMLVGLPGSGKSTYAKRIADSNTKYFSSDATRKELYGDESCQQDHNKVFSIMHGRTLDALRNGFDVIYDATNITRKSRRSILDLIPPYVDKECIVVWAPIKTCIERDKSRERTVGSVVIDKMLRRFEAPFYDEGFNSIRLHSATEYDEDEYRIEVISNLNISHDNPHHSVDVYTHCLLCEQNLTQANVPEFVRYAGYIHDIGKPYTKTFVNRHGETTEVAHYYDHQAVGAWISYGLPSTNAIELAWLVSTHMAPFINLKYYNSLAPIYKKWIDALHIADKEAH